MKVSEVKARGKDEADLVIEEVYARYDPFYAVYRTRERVVVQFADAPDQEKIQRAALSKLSPIRGEINGLIDGWRHSKNHRQHATARRFERRVADALVVALEDDLADAALLLQGIKNDLVTERTSRGRFQYLEIASAAVAVALVFDGLSTIAWGWLSPASYSNTVRLLWMASAAGAWGAFFSVAIAMRSRTVLTDLQLRDNASDAILRIVIGAISAPVFICLFVSKLISFKIGDADVATLAHPERFTDSSWMAAFVVAFVAGFLERLIPDLLAKAVAKGAGAPTPSETMTASKAISPPAPGPAPRAADVEAVEPAPAPAPDPQTAADGGAELQPYPVDVEASAPTPRLATGS